MSAFTAAARIRSALVAPKSKAAKSAIPLVPVASDSNVSDVANLDDAAQGWLSGTGWSPKSLQPACIPGADGKIARILVGHDVKGDDPFASLSFGRWPTMLPAGVYTIDPDALAGDATLAERLVRAWLFGSHRDTRFKADTTSGAETDAQDAPKAQLVIPAGCDADTLLDEAHAITFGRDLINAPANILGPQELQDAAADLAASYDATFSAVIGDDLLAQNFPLIHAVGRASSRAPRLLEMQWAGPKSRSARTVTLIGKGVVFDTGGLNLKPGNSMTLMKKDMGGAAAALTCAALIMAAKLPVRLRVLIPVAENSIDGSAFRPGDVLTSRNGMTVEIGNTDAEGRLILADALALAEEQAPDELFTFATLTGAARVGFGTDLPPFATTDPVYARDLQATSIAIADPLWEQPFWQPYDRQLASPIADVSHISDSPLAGSITAALFLKRFVTKAGRYTHIDLYGWVPAARPGRPKGGSPQAARAVFSTLQNALLHTNTEA